MKIKINPPKACSCGKIYDEVPEGARSLLIGDPLDGYVFECPCTGTSVFVPIKKVVISDQ